MAQNIYFVVAFERFTDNILSDRHFNTIKDAETEARELLHYSNVARVEILKNESLLETFGRNEGDKRAYKVKNGIVSTIRLQV